MSTQTLTSANTSINSTQLPYIYKHINWKHLMANTMKAHEYIPGYIPTILDFGCGKYTAHIRDYVLNKGFNWIGYDPYNGYKCVENIWDLLFMPIDLIICSNVLNVIKEEEVIEEIHDMLQRKRQEYGCPYFIKIYEGNNSGIGKESKKDCWQRNKPTASYKRHDEEIVKKIITYWTDKVFVI